MYSIDFIKTAVKYVRDKGHTIKEFSEAFGVNESTYYDWKKKLENGHFERKTIQTRHRKIDREALKRAVEEKPDAYLYELAEPFGCSEQAVFAMLKKLNLPLKKRPSHMRKNPKKSGRPTVSS
jgi:transposase